MPCRCPGNKTLSETEPMMASLKPHIYASLSLNELMGQGPGQQQLCCLPQDSLE